MKKIIVAMICLMLIIPAHTVNASNNNGKNVLIITSYSANSKWPNQIISNIKSEAAGSELDIQYHTEYLDTDKHSFYQYKAEFEQILDKKYDDVPLDAIVTIGFDAFDFVQNSNIAPFEDVPLISGSLDYFYVDDYPLKRPYIGNKTKIKAGEHYEVIKDIQPDISKVYFLSANDKRLSTVIEELKKCYSKNGVETAVVSIENLEHFNFDNELKDSQQALIISYMEWSEKLRENTSNQFIQYIREFYQGPVYMLDGPKFLDTMDNSKELYPSIGGLMRDRSAEGSDLGKKMIDLLEHPTNHGGGINVLDGTVMLDYNALQAHGLYQKSLTKKYEIMNAPFRDVVISRDMLFWGLSIFVAFLSCIVIILVVTLRKNNLLFHRVARSEQRYKRLLALLPDTVLVIRNGVISYVNEVGLIYLEAERAEDLIGKEAKILFPTSGVPSASSSKQLIEKQILITLKGWKKEVEIHCSNYNEDGPASLLVIHDITEQQMLRERMEYDQLRNQFFANLSHELRTPINVVLSTSQLLEKKLANNLDQSLAQYNGILRQNSYRLVRLINNLIDSTKIDAGFIEINLAVYNIVEITENLVLSILPFVETRGIKVTFDTEEEEIFTRLDKEKYERIILNLLSNSIKYSKKSGEVFIHIGCLQGIVEIKVSDNGIGIPQEKLEAIFDPFVQVNKSSIRNVEGSGIGLFIVKSLVDLHEGNITVKSQEGEYTEFTIVLPVVEVEESELVLVQPSYDHVKDAIQIELSDIDFE